MDKKKQVRKKKRPIIKSKEIEPCKIETEEKTIFTSVTGVHHLILSHATQRAINCVLGENVSHEYPWLFVETEVIQDNLSWHRDSSEFLPVKNDFLSYTDPQVLIGYKKTYKDTQIDEFYICTTVESKNMVLDMLNEQNENLVERLKNITHKKARYWSSLGSEQEILQLIVKNMRPLFAIEISTEYPIFKQQRKFSFCLAQNSYIEVEPNEQSFVGSIYRRTIDVAVQAAPYQRNNETQTDIINIYYNKYTDYQYEYREKRLNWYEHKRLVSFLKQAAEGIYDKICVNNSMNIYLDDYRTLKNRQITKKLTILRPILSFRDVKACKKKKISAVAWHPRISGLVAVAYTKNPKKNITTSELDYISNTTFSPHLVLIWCYTDNLRPKMVLYSTREINCLCFCPYNLNILVGGCSSGQIIIWDLTNKLEEVEQRELQRAEEIKNRQIMYSLMTWMKQTINVRNVYPVCKSDLRLSHEDEITTINWLSHLYNISKNGKIIPRLEPYSENDLMSTQFLSAGLDGCVLVWDIHLNVRSHLVKTTRLTTRPNELTKNYSPLNAYDNVLRPIFKIFITDGLIRYPITSLIIDRQNFTYRALNPETTSKWNERTYFKAVKPTEPTSFEPSFKISTNTGEVLSCSWRGNDYDQGGLVNYDYSSNFIKYIGVHDGPIVSCQLNPFLNSCILTVGGKIFAVWDSFSDKKPAFWRRCSIRYLSGFWTPASPAIFVTIRKDSKYELWNLFSSSKTPLRIIRQPGLMMMDIFSENATTHVRKRTFVTADENGTVLVNRVEQKERLKIDLNVAKIINLREKAIQREAVYKEWLENWKKKYIKIKSIDQSQQKDSLQMKHMSKFFKTFVIRAEPKQYNMDKIFENREEKHTYKVMLKRKHINLAEVELNKQTLINLIQEENERHAKVNYYLLNKDRIFKNAKNTVMPDPAENKKKKFPFDSKSYIYKKQKLYENYLQMEEEALENIRNFHYEQVFSWSDLIDSRIATRKNVKDKTGIVRALQDYVPLDWVEQDNQSEVEVNIQ